MRRALICTVLCGLLGCEDFQKGMDGPARQTTVAPGGIASSGEVTAVQNATGGGAVTPTPVAAAPVGQPAEPAKPSGSIIGKTGGRIVDLVEAKKNPKVVEVDNKVVGADPLTSSFSAYVSITSRASVLNFKHQMDILKAADDRSQYPSFKEAEQMMKQFKIEVAALPPYQMYGYDQKSGGLVLLEDKGEKIRLYKLNNIPIDEADKSFDKP